MIAIGCLACQNVDGFVSLQFATVLVVLMLCFSARSATFVSKRMAGAITCSATTASTTSVGCASGAGERMAPSTTSARATRKTPTLPTSLRMRRPGRHSKSTFITMRE